MKQYFEIYRPDGSIHINRIDFSREIPDYNNAYSPISCRVCMRPATSFFLHPQTKETVFLCNFHKKESREVNINKKNKN